MKKNLFTVIIGIFLCLLSFNYRSQTYSSWGLAINQTSHMYDSLTTAGDSLKFRFTNTHTTAWGNPVLIVYYEGNFGDWFDYMDLYDETLGYQGSTNSSTFGYDCAPEDSMVFALSTSDINFWTANNNIVFTLIPNSGNSPCSFSRVRAKLIYNYCLSGLPVQYATINMTNVAVCSSEGPFTLTGTPAGGTFSGPGVTGNSFSPANLASGSYMIGYTATDSQTCTTTGYLSIQVKPRPIVNNNSPVYACNGSTATLDASSGNTFTWYSNAALTNTIITANTYTTPSLTQTTDYWVASLDQSHNVAITSVTNTGSAIIDHNSITGDDRGGIAVTKRWVYYNGDNNAIRINVNLTPTTAVSLPVRDGMFSDLSSGKLWTLWDNVQHISPMNSPNNFDVDALRGLDSNLNFTNEYIYLSQPINMGNNNQQNGIFSGAGLLGLYSGNTQHWYVVDLDNGNVSDLGFASTAELYGSENWSDWGVLQSSCAGAYSVIYRDWNDDDIHRRVLPNGAVTSIGSFSGLSDMACLTFNPWNNRWYFHYEGNASTFGGSSETLGYANATGAVAVCPGNGLSCPTKVTVNVPADVTLSFPSTAVCLADGSTPLSGGSPSGGTYSGVGVGTGASGTVFYPALAGIGVHTISYTYQDTPSGCVDAASKVVTVDACTSLAERSISNGISIFPNPNNGSFYFTVNSDVNSLSIEVLDIQSRIVYASKESGLTTGSTKQIDLTNIQAGMYFVKMNDGVHQHTQRIIVAR